MDGLISPNLNLGGHKKSESARTMILDITEILERISRSASWVLVVFSVLCPDQPEMYNNALRVMNIGFISPAFPGGLDA